jgi:hypothetical protein
MGTHLLIRLLVALIVPVTAVPPTVKSGLEWHVAPVMTGGRGLLQVSSDKRRTLPYRYEIELFKEGTRLSATTVRLFRTSGLPGKYVTASHALRANQPATFFFAVDSSDADLFRIKLDSQWFEGSIQKAQLFGKVDRDLATCVDGFMEALTRERASYEWTPSKLPCSELPSGFYRNEFRTYFAK